MIGYGKRVLVVDDEAALRELLTVQLEPHGFLIVQAGDGHEALYELRRRHFDVMITDYAMPDLNGLELLRHSRIICSDLPVIVMSGTDESLVRLAMAWGAFAYLPKPYDLSRLLTVLSTAMDTPDHLMIREEEALASDTASAYSQMARGCHRSEGEKGQASMLDAIHEKSGA